MTELTAIEQRDLAFESHSFFFELASKVYDELMDAYNREDYVECHRLRAQWLLLDSRFRSDVKRHKELCGRTKP